MPPPPPKPERTVTSDYTIVKPIVKPIKPSGNARVDQLRQELAAMDLAKKQAAIGPIPKTEVAEGLIPPDLDIRVPSPPPPVAPQRPPELPRRIDPDRDRNRRVLPTGETNSK